MKRAVTIFLALIFSHCAVVFAQDADPETRLRQAKQICAEHANMRLPKEARTASGYEAGWESCPDVDMALKPFDAAKRRRIDDEKKLSVQDALKAAKSN